MKTAAPLLLVDGYNIIGHWTDLQYVRDQFGLELARQELVEALINYSSHQGYQTQVVFDAQLRRQPASEETPCPHLTVRFTDWSQTADTYIEKYCARFFRQGGASRLIVATSDRAQQLTVLGYGAEWMSAPSLVQAMATSQTQVRKVPKKQNQRPGTSLARGLDPQVREKLQKLRLG
ncbi:MAG: NYN domain-containing protein [Cyanobacteriota bacterium]|jgi:predicted RNA-binding protein with PIN domain